MFLWYLNLLVSYKPARLLLREKALFILGLRPHLSNKREGQSVLIHTHPFHQFCIKFQGNFFLKVKSIRKCFTDCLVAQVLMHKSTETDGYLRAAIWTNLLALRWPYSLLDINNCPRIFIQVIITNWSSWRIWADLHLQKYIKAESDRLCTKCSCYGEQWISTGKKVITCIFKWFMPTQNLLKSRWWTQKF